MAITLNQHKENVTKKIIGRFSDMTAPKLGLKSWFPSETTTSKQVSIEVQRNRKLAAVDVERGTEGNLNTFGKFSEKIYVPPFFKEFFNFSDLDVYERTFGNGSSPNESDYLNMLRTSTEKLMVLKNKIEIATEIQRSQALQTGIVTMKNGDNIDFKRKATSIVDLGAGNYWDGTEADILNDLAEGVKFCRQEGKSGVRNYDAILGSQALAAIFNNADLLKLLDNRNLNVGMVGTTMFDDATGLNYHGRLNLKNAAIDLWTYDDFYELADGTNVEFIDTKNAIVIPRDFMGKQAYAGVPAIMRDTQNAEFNQWITQVAAEHYVNNFVDPRNASHIFQLYSAPLAIPFSVDRVWTAKVLA